MTTYKNSQRLINLGFPHFFHKITWARRYVLNLWRRSSHERVPKQIRLEAFASKSISSSNEKCEHCDVDGHDIDHFYSLHPKFHPNKSTINKDDGGKGGCRGSNGFQTKGKPQIKFQVRPTTKAKVMAWPLHKINFLNWKNWSLSWLAKRQRKRR